MTVITTSCLDFMCDFCSRAERVFGREPELPYLPQGWVKIRLGEQGRAEPQHFCCEDHARAYVATNTVIFRPREL